MRASRVTSKKLLRSVVVSHVFEAPSLGWVEFATLTGLDKKVHGTLVECVM